VVGPIASIALSAMMVLLFACASRTVADSRARIRDAEEFASNSGFHRLEPRSTDPDSLPVAAWVRPAASHSAADASLHIYIEGDGLAWRSRRHFSLDPTPVRATGLRLAAADPSLTTIVYLGRPCQYGSPRTSGCRPILWTAARHGEDVLDAMDRRIDELIEQLDGPHPITLIGYSGGGVVATLLSARRKDVRLLVTIAAPLDIDGWTRSTKTSPLVGSLSPMEWVDTLRGVQQHHFVGREDARVPTEATEAFHRALGPDAPSQLTIVDGMDHGSWPDAWAMLIEASGLFE